MPQIPRRDTRPQSCPPKAAGRSCATRRRAAALILVLIAAAFLGFIVTEIIAGGARRLAWETQRSGNDELRREAFSALESTLGVLAAFARTDGVLYSPAQGWSDPLAFAGHVVPNGVELSVTLRDESGFYGINSLAENVTLLRRFFADLGIGDSEAGRLADCLADWTDAGDAPRANGAERDSYPEGVAPPNRPLQSLEEMRDVLGFREAFFNEDNTGNELWKRLTSAVSLLSSSTQPNVNTAPRAVLEILTARHGFNPDALIQGRGNGEDDGFGETTSTRSATSASGERGVATGTVYRNASDLTLVGAPPALGADVSFSCSRLRVIVRATRADVAVVLDTLLDTTSAAGGGVANQFPFTILQQRVNARLQD